MPWSRPSLRGEIEKKTDVLIDYLIDVRRFAFVCKTKKMDKRAIKVVKQFYVDELGNTSYEHVHG